MAYTPAQARATMKYQREKLTKFTAQIDRETGDKFKALLAENGDVANRILVKAIREYIENHS